MSVEQNKALVHRFVEEVFNKGNLDAIDDIYATTYVGHSPGSPPLSREENKQRLAMVRAAFPDMNETIEDMIAEGDKVVNRSTFRGTHKGEFMGLPATGKPFQITGIFISRIAEGKIVEVWGLPDLLGLMQQIGAIPAPGQGESET